MSSYITHTTVVTAAAVIAQLWPLSFIYLTACVSTFQARACIYWHGNVTTHLCRMCWNQAAHYVALHIHSYLTFVGTKSLFCPFTQVTSTLFIELREGTSRNLSGFTVSFSYLILNCEVRKACWHQGTYMLWVMGSAKCYWGWFRWLVHM